MPDFENSLPMILYRALDKILPAYRELFSRYDLTEQQWRILRVIWSHKNVTSTKLSEKTLLSPPSLVNLIDKLEKKELVTRVRSIEDRRQIYVIATVKGRVLQEDVIPQVAEIHKNIRNAVSQEEWQQLESILEKIAAPSASSSVTRTATL